MKSFFGSLVLSFVLSSTSFAAGLPGFKMVGPKAIKEDDVEFHYMSNDGSVDLSCAHVYDSPEASDWDVWCGKGSGYRLRQFRVHFLVRELENRAAQKSAYEVLYWVIDRDAKKTAFSSTSTWMQFDNLSKLNTMSFSQGVENDYAYLTVTLKPRR